MRLLLTLILVTSAPSAYAAFNASSCPGDGNFSQIFLEDGVQCSTVNNIRRELTEITAFMGQEPPLTLFVQAKSYASFGTYGRIIVLNDQQLAWGALRPQTQNVEIWAHELGHTFFSTWLARDFRTITGFRDYMNESAKIQIEKRNPFHDTSKELASKWNADFAAARDIQVPYNELFADLVGALYGGSPDAMTKAMVVPGMPELERSNALFYAFQGSYDLAKWQQTEVHYFFAPVRAFIGEHFLKFPMKNEQKAIVVQKVYQACLAEIQKNWKAGKGLPAPSAANGALIHTLEHSE